MTTYTVRPGDTLTGIASQYGTSVSRIAKDNDIANPDLIRVGQELSIGGQERSGATSPRAAEYTVQRGDTFSEIAAKHDLSLAALEKLNPQVKNINVIYPGQELYVKDAHASPPRPQPTPEPKPEATSKPEPKPEGTSKPEPKPEPTPHPSPASRPDTSALPVGMPNTEGMSESKEYALYSKYVSKYGDAKAKKDLADGKRVIVGLRVKTPFTSDRPYRGTYDDRIVVMWKDSSGKPHVEEFKANTEPNRRWADDPSQRDKPVGRLVGNKTYHYKKSFNSGFGGNILSPDLRHGNPTVQRDTNRNHRIDKGDGVYSGDWGGQAYYFHRGGTSDTYSAGCQTMDQGRFNSFWAALGPQSEFSYVLAEVADGARVA